MHKEIAKSSFASRLYELRISNGINQKVLANALHVTSQSISNYESGKREPRIPDLIAIADYFNVSVDYLIGRSDKC